MDPKNKFAAETVRQLQQSLDGVAPYQETELSKQRAIRTLSPQIFALRSKGYSWTAVAAMLSERGVPVSVAALRTYLRRVREEAANEAPRTPTEVEIALWAGMLRVGASMMTLFFAHQTARWPSGLLYEVAGVAHEVEGADVVEIGTKFGKVSVHQPMGLTLDARGNVRSDASGATNVPGVFAAGDVSRGQSLVVWAIADGRRVAAGVDAWLRRVPMARAG
jgi:thioredoxin reductase